MSVSACAPVSAVNWPGTCAIAVGSGTRRISVKVAWQGRHDRGEIPVAEIPVAEIPVAEIPVAGIPVAGVVMRSGHGPVDPPPSFLTAAEHG